MRVDYETLMKEHDALSALADAFDRAITTSGVASDAVLEMRDRLSRAVLAHIAKEDSAVYPLLIAGKDAAAAAAAHEVVRECRDLMSDWAEYCEAWTGARAVADWSGFVAETQALLARLRARISRENELLYPLALRASHIRLRA